ncbi:E3 ubiquitin-protein ligase ATL23-like [Musa acuminata AAA Group]|uniref:E3 ubiquitin-protein ligase ATL23-like n=1 Tax=Musa acuminata AAA Group TaxID=214697 RepID=UPI0031E44359
MEMMALLFLFVAMFLMCFGIGVVFMVYMCILWSSMLQNGEGEKGGKGLSTAELERLGGAADGGAVAGQECAVCLEDIEAGQAARVLPDCRHAFHRPCADRWLSAHPDCPLCRAYLHPPPPPPSVPLQVVLSS